MPKSLTSRHNQKQRNYGKSKSSQTKIVRTRRCCAGVDRFTASLANLVLRWFWFCRWPRLGKWLQGLGLALSPWMIAVVIASLMGDKTKGYDDTSKVVAMAGFGGIAVGALIFMFRAMSVSGTAFKSSPGFGLFICLIAGIAGLAMVMGLIKMPDPKAPTPPPPPPPIV